MIYLVCLAYDISRTESALDDQKVEVVQGIILKVLEVVWVGLPATRAFWAKSPHKFCLIVTPINAY